VFNRRQILLGTIALAACRRGVDASAIRMPAMRPVDAERIPIRIAFGSCNHEYEPQTHYDAIAAQRPDLWIWLGDNVYGDTSDERELRDKYAQVLTAPAYRRFVDAVPVVGTWDDHDMGRNDGGRDFAARAQNQAVLLDFLGEPLDSPRRRQAGVYARYDLGVAPHKVRVILLDGRSQRERPGPEADILGEVQWRWLEQQLRESDAAVHLIGNGYQFTTEEHPNETWAKFPAAQRRLFELIARTRAPGVILLSGDRHHADIGAIEQGPLAYPLHEHTASGLTHANGRRDRNRHRVAEQYTHENFGVIELDWARGRVELRTHAVEGELAVRHVVELATLQRGSRRGG
jgi:alkaline phosphatase D